MAKNQVIKYGEYSTKKDREEYGKDLRRAHFLLGTEQKPGETNYKLDYVAYNVDQDKSKSAKLVDEGVLRKSHFVLGLEKDPRHSSYKNDYSNKTAEKVALREDVIKDLRATHYKLGSQESDFCSTNKQDYPHPEKTSTGGSNLEGMKTKMRTHNFRFGADPVAYQSSNSATYKPLFPNNQNNIPSAGGEISLSTAEIRKTHFLLGNDGNNFVTTSSVQFPGYTEEQMKPNLQKSVSSAVLRKSHIPFTVGSQPNDPKGKFVTMAQSTYTKLPMSVHEDTKSSAKYLRSAHFNFGNDNVAPVPESKSAYMEKEFHPPPYDPTLANNIRSSHIGYLFNPKHGGNSKSIGMSTYRDKISEEAKGKRPEPDYEHKDLHRTTFVLGSDGPTTQSEAKSKFVQQSGDLKKPDISAAMERMRKPNFEYKHLSEPEDKDHYLSQMKKSFSPVKGDSDNRSQQAEFKKYFTSAHFALGSQEADMATTKELYHSPQKGESAALNVEKMKDLRKEHFALGAGARDMKTVYQWQHQWIQPVGGAPLQP